MGADFTPKNVLFTGGCGFIGSHALRLLVLKYPEYNFVNLDVLDRCATRNNNADIDGRSNYTYVHGDICNLDLVSHLMAFHQIDTVMHFAAQSHVDASFGNPLSHTKTNVLGTHTLLEAARRHRSSDSCTFPLTRFTETCKGMVLPRAPSLSQPTRTRAQKQLRSSSSRHTRSHTIFPSSSRAATMCMARTSTPRRWCQSLSCVFSTAKSAASMVPVTRAAVTSM